MARKPRPPRESRPPRTPRPPRNGASDGAPRKAPFPTREQLLEYIAQGGGKADPKDIARAFHLRGDDRHRLRAALKNLASEGELEGSGKHRRATGTLPPVMVVEVTGTDEDGMATARPTRWDEEREPPHIAVKPHQKSRDDIAVGVRLLVRLTPDGKHRYTATILKHLPSEDRQRMLGQFEPREKGGLVRPVSRKDKDNITIPAGMTGDAKLHDLVLVELLQGGKRRAPDGKVIEVLGRMDDPKAASLVAIHKNGIPTAFRKESIEQAEKAEAPHPEPHREDLRDIPLVTIDGEDARDFDDAVFAEMDGKGWHLIVAIADVAHYVRPDTPLDEDAKNRGNSVYFPDRVVPMLPEALSNGLCSLRPDEDRFCLAVHMWIDGHGELVKWKFVRGLMRSRHRLTYERVQEARNKGEAGIDAIIAPLYGAFETLHSARVRRGTMDLDLPDFRVFIGDDGKVSGIAPRERLDSHKLIEEFMVTANIAAAKELQGKRLPAVYRVHEPPSPLKLEELRVQLQQMGLSFGKGMGMKPGHYDALLIQAEEKQVVGLASLAVLRAQTQAYYGPENLGHFGLSLTHYTHFTSPIRRYSDLIVHRALLKAIGKQPDAVTLPDAEQLEEVAEHISYTERRAQQAERDAMDRYIAAFMTDRVGARFEAAVTHVATFGLFVTLKENGASGLLPLEELPDDYYRLDKRTNRLIGRQKHKAFGLGMKMLVELTEAQTLTGSLRFSFIKELR